MSFTRELPRYRRRDLVQALKIRTIIQTPQGYELHFEDERFAPHLVGMAWLVRFAPMSGGYFVVARDGSQSFSPAEPFEAGFLSADPEDLESRVAGLAAEFEDGQWWVQELDAAVADGTPDQKRAVAVVRNLLRQIAELQT